ncbi:hypothetical protein DICA4_B01244 [Diutina catenulata]
MDDHYRLIELLGSASPSDVDDHLRDEYVTNEAAPESVYVAHCLLIAYTFPASTSAATLARWVRTLAAVPMHPVPASECSELVASTVDRCRTDHHFTDATTDGWIRAKIHHDAGYCSDVDHYAELLKLSFDPDHPSAHPSALEQWYRGVLLPYRYYHSHCADPVSLRDYLHPDTHAHQFAVVRGASTDAGAWLAHAVLPLAGHHGGDLAPLEHSLFDDEPEDVVAHFERLETVFAAMVEAELELDAYRPLLRLFLAQVYYLSVHEGGLASRLSSVKLLRVYDVVARTLDLFESAAEPLDVAQVVSGAPEGWGHYQSLHQFVSDAQNPLAPLYEARGASIVTLEHMLSLCVAMYPTSGLTLAKTLGFYHDQTHHPQNLVREVSRLTSTLAQGTWPTWWQATERFLATFVPASCSVAVEANKVVVERFLFANLFAVVKSPLFETHRQLVDDDTWFDAVADKFWDSFNSASNLNDKIGQLAHAQACVSLLDDMALDVDDRRRQRLVQAKHLLKALALLKNFKFFIDPGQPVTPKQLVARYRDDPLGLVNRVLEMNPKSYLAFDKLFKILNDFVMSDEPDHSSPEKPTEKPTENPSSEGSQPVGVDRDHAQTTTPAASYFTQVKTMCIESALIDGNFNFAYAQATALFDFYSRHEVSDNWLTFYQVGKWVSPAWFDDDADAGARLAVLLKQRTILGRCLAAMDPSDCQRIVVGQWSSVNAQLASFYSPEALQVVTDCQFVAQQAPSSVQDEVHQLTSSLLSDASTTSTQASRNLQKMFVSGLGWAIGANKG